MKNYFIGIGLLLLAFYLMFQQTPEQQQREGERGAPRAEDNGSMASADVPRPDGNATPALRPAPANATVTPGSVPPSELNASAPLVAKARAENLTEPLLANGSSSFVFTNLDGAIREVRLAKNERLSKSYEMLFPKGTERAFSLRFENEDLSALTLPGYEPSAYDLNVTGSGANQKVVFTNTSGGMEIRREYSRESNESYLIRHKTVVTNRGATHLKLDRLRLGLGASLPIARLYNPFDSASAYLNVGYYNSGEPRPEGCSCAECSGRIDGEAEEFFQPGEMGDTGRLERHLTSLKWACVNNQFFVSIVRPVKEQADALVRGRAWEYLPDANATEKQTGMTGSLSVPFGSLAPGETRSVTFLHYAGPKDFVGLAKVGDEQDKVMQFGVFWWISEPLNWFLNKLRDLLGNFGLAIIALTILMKLVLWPLTAKATRSQKRMQALQEPMAELREKHKKNPQKLNQEMMKFYKEQGVNPFAGCWPILIQIPIFLGMFWMLRSAAELYGQSFLWMSDLSEQDNVSDMSGFSVNVLPLLMVATQWLQMRLTPMQLGPNASEAQQINAKMMRMMPFMFLIFLYFFSSALVLYWTAQNVMSIIQTLVTKKGKAPVDLAAERNQESKTNEDEKAKGRKAAGETLDEEERMHRQTLGLKLRGEVKRKRIEEIYRERITKYHPDKLNNLGPKRQAEAIEKREKLEAAYEFMLKKIGKGS